jgi:hypothetical protein
MVAGVAVHEAVRATACPTAGVPVASTKRQALD